MTIHYLKTLRKHHFPIVLQPFRRFTVKSANNFSHKFVMPLTFYFRPFWDIRPKIRQGGTATLLPEVFRPYGLLHSTEAAWGGGGGGVTKGKPQNKPDNS
jgi:hypothetical protein